MENDTEIGSTKIHTPILDRMGSKTNFVVSPALSDAAEWGPAKVGVERNGEWREHEFRVKNRIESRVGSEVYTCTFTHKDLCLS